MHKPCIWPPKYEVPMAMKTPSAPCCAQGTKPPRDLGGSLWHRGVGLCVGEEGEPERQKGYTEEGMPRG